MILHSIALSFHSWRFVFSSLDRERLKNARAMLIPFFFLPCNSHLFKIKRFAFAFLSRVWIEGLLVPFSPASRIQPVALSDNDAKIGRPLLTALSPIIHPFIHRDQFSERRGNLLVSPLVPARPVQPRWIDIKEENRKQQRSEKTREGTIEYHCINRW